MKDLTQGSVLRHVLTMAAPIAFGMLFQTLYYLVDLYFVARLGDDAVAGVSAAGNVMLIIFALTQVLGVGAVALISHAVGRKDRQEANLLFNQSLAISALMGLITLVAGYALVPVYMGFIAADPATELAGRVYLYWFIPGLALQFAVVSMGSALRATGIVKPTMIVQIVTVLQNVVLAPVLIAGWGTGKPLGVAGAGLASTLSIVTAVVMLWLYFVRLEKYVSFDRTQWRPQFHAWRRMLNVGLPSGGEMLFMFVFVGVIYWCIRNEGSTAQAGFGIGSRITQSIFLPAMAVAFAAGPVAGQNFGARNFARVREAFYRTAVVISVIMATLTVLAHWSPALLVAAFSSDAEVGAVAETFLIISSYNFVAQGLIFTCSSMFQGLGDTRPALLSTSTRLATFVPPAIWLSAQEDFRVEHIWYLSVATVTLQAIFSVLLVRWQFRRKLPQEGTALQGDVVM